MTKKRFDYYDGLTQRQKATYRKSDAVTEVRLRDVKALGVAAARIGKALETERTADVQRATAVFLNTLTDDLRVPRVQVKVLAKRPRSHGEELYGIYEQEDDGPALIQVWMRTAKNKNVVTWRTYLRTVIHEACHHIDYKLLKLPDTFHTQGFFQRESSLMRSVAPKREKAPKKPKPVKKPKAAKAKPAAARERKPRAPKVSPEPPKPVEPVQLELGFMLDVGRARRAPRRA